MPLRRRGGSRIRHLFAADDNVVGVGGAARPKWPDGRPPRWFPAEFGWVVGCSYTGQPVSTAPVRNLLGCNMAFRRVALDAIGSFREDMGRVGQNAAGCEETELCLRLTDRYPDCQILYDPLLLVEHRVTAHRTTVGYFLRRCHQEGRSKAMVTRLAGRDRGLASERHYVRRTIPAAVARNVAHPAGPKVGLGIISAIGGGVVAAAAGYARGQLTRRNVEAVVHPVRLLDIDVDVEPLGIERHDGPTGHVYRRARLLAFEEGRPIGQLDLDIPSEGLSGPRLLAEVNIAVRCAAAARSTEGTRRRSLVTERAAVVVATRDRPERLAKCLDSILALDFPEVAVIVVDNSPSSTAARDLVSSDYPMVTYVCEPEPGLAMAHNCGLRLVDAPIVAFTDDDVTVDRGWLRTLVESFGPGIGCVTGLIVPAELDTLAQVWVEEHGGFSKGFERLVFSMDDDAALNRPSFPYAPGAFGSGANMAFDTAALRGIGGFDPTLGTGTKSRGGDDLAAFVDIIRAGHALVYEPAAVVRHTHPREVARVRSQAHNYGVGLSAYLTRTISRDPRVAWQLARCAPSELARLVSRRRAGTRSSGVPSSLLWLELAGLLRGPFAYRQALRHHRTGAST